ncbi:MAG: hypothetical protein ACI936_002011, partial [Paraglaciecola sp.]
DNALLSSLTFIFNLSHQLSEYSFYAVTIRKNMVVYLK